MLRKLTLSEFNNYIKLILDGYKDYEIIDIKSVGKSKSKKNKHYEFILQKDDIRYSYIIPYYTEDKETTVELFIHRFHRNFDILSFYNESEELLKQYNGDVYMDEEDEDSFFAYDNIVKDYEYNSDTLELKIII